MLPAFASFDTTGGPVVLNNAANDFANAGVSSVGGSVTDAIATPPSNFTLVNVNAVQLGNIKIGTGNLSVTAGGSITQANTINDVPADGIRTGSLAPLSVTFTVTALLDILLANAQ